MTASPFLDRRAIIWLACLLLPLAMFFGGTLSEFALPEARDPGALVSFSETGNLEEIARLGRWIAQIPYARIVFPSALIVSVWLMSLIVAYGRARYIARKERKAEARLFDELVNRSRVGYLAVDGGGRIAATNPALERMLGSDVARQGASVTEIGISMSELLPGEVVVVKLKTQDGRSVPALAATMSGDDETDTQIIVTPLLDSALDSGAAAGRSRALLRNINHELRTPLSIILGSATLLESDVSEENAELVDAIRIGGERLLHILETLVLLSELEAADSTSVVGSVELVHVLRQVLHHRRSEGERRGLEIFVKLPSEPVHVRGDMRGVEHICGQLIDNAIKFTETGSITIECEVCDGEASVAVVDTGRGMDAEVLSNALADFRDQKKSRRSTGSIGLSLAKLLAHEMGARLALSSMPGTGTTATVTFSVADDGGAARGVAA